MLRHFSAAALLCGAALAAPNVHPAQGIAGESHAVALLTSGMPRDALRVAKDPAGAVTAGELVLDFWKMSLNDVVAKLGGELRIAGEAEAGTGFAWVCYVSAEPAPQTVWFVANYTNDRTFPLSGVALEAAPPLASAACTTLPGALPVALGTPGLGATMADLDTVFGPGGKPDETGTVGYFFGSENQPDGINVITKDRGYRLADGKVAAVSAGAFIELQ
jgi:hypothetical protein